VVFLGLTMRFYLERLRLLMVPRLAAVLIIVVILMLVISVVGNRLGFETGLSVALFPMVIMAMTIERMSVVWEERGALEAIQQGLGSLLAAAICYAVMDMEMVRHLLFVFPELLLVLLAATLLLGRYSGYRLMEVRRFRDLGGA
jgi:tellurite resistance protein TehA-like permease